MNEVKRPSAGSVLRHRAFALFLAGRVASLLGSSMAPLAIAFAILDHSGTATQVGDVLAAQSIPLVAFLLVGGGAADRWGRRRVMVVADVMRAAAQGALAAWVLLGRPPLWAFAASAAVIGIGQAIFGPATTGLVPELVTDPADLQIANSLRGLATSLATVAGPTLAGIVVATVNPGWAIAFDAATYVISAALLAALHLPPRRATDRTPFVAQLREGWGEFRSRTWLWVIVAQYAVFHLVVLAPFMVLGVVIAKTSLGGPAVWGAILAALSLGSVSGSLATLRFGARRPLLVATLSGFTWIAPTLLLGVSAPAWAVAAGAFSAGTGLGVFGPLWDTTLQHHIPERVLSRVSSYDYLGSVALLPVGYALAGPLAVALGAHTLLLAAAAWVGISTIAVLAVPSVRSLPANAAASAGLKARVRRPRRPGRR